MNEDVGPTIYIFLNGTLTILRRKRNVLV
uniref:Uncharacterized protein n=1 Tax=Rhizophora mucronata TaxID=61149 RepID=A0A2P2III6_RHIMU